MQILRIMMKLQVWLLVSTGKDVNQVLAGYSQHAGGVDLEADGLV